MIRRFRNGFLQVLLLASWSVAILHADSGRESWLRYAPLDDAMRAKYESVPANLVVLGESQVFESAQSEMIRGIKSMTGKSLASTSAVEAKSIVLGTLTALHAVAPGLVPPRELGLDGYWLVNAKIRGFDCLVITGLTDRGVLYGVFALLSKIARGENIAVLNEVQQPFAAMRWVDQWDNLNGSIERGYAGPSIFFEKGSVRADLTRAGEYARLLASIGINGCTINNVNADPRIMDDEFISQLARVAEVFRPWGVGLAVSVDLG